MATQTTISILVNHTASLKQIRFQPGANNKNVLATTSRDGSVRIWDLRCRGGDEGVLQFYPPIVDNARNCWNTGSINGAHRPTYQTRQAQKTVSTDTPWRDELPGRIGDVSITSISFLAPGKEHFLLTGSEADASIKLWDIRSVQNKRKIPVPISYTRQPHTHSRFRHFGINSLNLSTDGSKVYSLCKDNTVYAYSTAHLILGNAPEFTATNSSSSRAAPQRPLQEGLGPIYGYRHPQLLATSFYVKSSLRKAQNDKCEMLAVGSSDGCAVLFPTDERYLSKPAPSSAASDSASLNAHNTALQKRPSLRRTGSSLSRQRIEDDVRISTNGTPLIRGHDREVGALTWTSEGNLVTLGDDYLVRCWHEDPAIARDLRTKGETGGRRWGCGWADVGDDWDAEEED